MKKYEIISKFNGKIKSEVVIEGKNLEEVLEKASKYLRVPKNMLYSDMYEIRLKK